MTTENRVIYRSPTAYNTWDNNGVITTVPAAGNSSGVAGDMDNTGFQLLPHRPGQPYRGMCLYVNLPDIKVTTSTQGLYVYTAILSLSNAPNPIPLSNDPVTWGFFRSMYINWLNSRGHIPGW